jgi:hypothetical protein
LLTIQDKRSSIETEIIPSPSRTCFHDGFSENLPFFSGLFHSIKELTIVTVRTVGIGRKGLRPFLIAGILSFIKERDTLITTNSRRLGFAITAIGSLIPEKTRLYIVNRISLLS